MLKPQDMVILLKLALEPVRSWSYNQLAYELRMSASEVHKGVGRLDHARLFNKQTKRPHRRACEEFLVHGVKYAFAPDVGPVTRGVPTGFAAPVLSHPLSPESAEMEAYVWPHPEGLVRGTALAPLFPAAVEAARHDEALYAALALLDAMRIGRARERSLAEKMLLETLRRAAE
jgi:hypothetical protein